MKVLHEISHEYIADIARYALGFAPDSEDGKWFNERSAERWSISEQTQQISFAEALSCAFELVQLFEAKQCIAVLKMGEVVKVGKNQIYFNESDLEYPYVVEQFEFNDDYKGTGDPMYSVIDGYKSFQDAYNAAQRPINYRRRVTCRQHNLEI